MFLRPLPKRRLLVLASFLLAMWLTFSWTTTQAQAPGNGGGNGPGHPELPMLPDEALPHCPDSLYTNPLDPSLLPAPDFSLPPVCKAKRHAIVHPSENAQGPKSPASTLDTLVQPNQAGGGGVIGGGTYAFAIHTLSCRYAVSGCSTSSPGVTQAYFNLSTQTPSLLSDSWSNYRFYNRVHFTHPSYSVTCSGSSGYESVSIGYIHGGGFNNTFSNRLISQAFVGTSCVTYDSGISTSGPGTLAFRVYRNGSTWALETWTGSWTRLLSATTSWSVAAEIDAGQELWRSGATTSFAPVRVPLNMVNKIRLIGTSNTILTSWHDAALKTPLQGITRARREAPLNVADAFGGDWTATSSYKVTN